MNKKDLEKIKSLKAEVDDLRKRATFKPSQMVTDTVNDYRTGKGIPIAITGYGDANYQKLRQHYYDAFNKLNRIVLENEMQIAKLTDPEIRFILRRYYLDGASQEEIANELNYSQQRISQKLDDFFSCHNQV